MSHNLFLDFLNRDSRQIYGLYTNTSEQLHIEMLTEAVNIAVFLCAEFCVVPPGFLAECTLTRKVISRRCDYLKERIIRLPMRENSLEEFFYKKQREYSIVRHSYSGLFNEKITQRFLRKMPQAIITRKTVVGDQMTEAWEEGLDDRRSIWNRLSEGVPTPALERIRVIPKILRDRDLAVTWPAIFMNISSLSGVDSAKFRLAVQYHYFQVYLHEYNLKIISDLPFARVDFGLYTSDLRYSYSLVKTASQAAGVWDWIRYMSACSMLMLKQQASFFRFRRNFDSIGGEARSCRDVAEAFAMAAEEHKEHLARAELRIPQLILSVIPAEGLNLSSEQIEIIAYRLELLTTSALAHLWELQNLANCSQRTLGSSLNTINSKDALYTKTKIRNKMNQKITLAIFTALRMERDVLIKRWKLEHQYGQLFWIGERNNVQILVYSPQSIGRVPAAIATTKALLETQPTMLVVLGIAGGFTETGVQLGDVLVAEVVADLATRKIHSAEDSSIAEFRANPFRTDKRIIEFLDSGNFDSSSWEKQVINEAEWPEGRRPTVRIGSVASLDDVVSSDEWRRALLNAWPKLLGVEMEAGGVCAAAEEFGTRVAVIRGVSDLADPRKSDSEWRGRAMKTVASLVEYVVDSGVLFSNGK